MENITLGQIVSAIGIISVIIGVFVKIYNIIKKAEDDRVKLRKAIENKDNLQNAALMILLQSNLTNTYFAYEKIGEIPDYIYQNWLNELKVYERLGGNSYIHELARRMEKFEITHTNILK